MASWIMIIPNISNVEMMWVDFKNRGTPKSSILIVFFHYKPSCGGAPIYETPLIFHHKPSSYWGTPVVT